MAKNSNKIVAGVGEIFIAPLNTTAPASATATLDAAFVSIGYTEAGATLSFERTVEDLEVAEEMAPVGHYETKQSGKFTFEAAQVTADIISLALNAGVVSATSTAHITPPDYASQSSVSIVLQTSQGARYYIPSARNVGAFERKSAKTGKTLIAFEYAMEKTTDAALFTAMPAMGTYAGIL